MGGLNTVTLDDVRKAEKRLAPILLPTPMVYSHERDAWLKLENLQLTGAYKAVSYTHLTLPTICSV